MEVWHDVVADLGNFAMNLSIASREMDTARNHFRVPLNP
jgi:hypothetical protein